MKRAAGRPKDLYAVENLLALKEVLTENRPTESLDAPLDSMPRKPE